MTIQLRPEVGALIEKRLQSGAFATPEEVIEKALDFLAEEEDWLIENKRHIAALIQEGWDQAERGELTSEEDLKAEMAQFKSEWLKQYKSE